MEPTINDKLRARAKYPGMVSHPAGWDGIVERLHDKLVELVPDYEVFQTKEKFGGLRFYISPLGGDDEEVWEQVYQLINEAEAESYRTCERCGQPGETRHEGWSRTLCERCHAERLGVELDRWEGEGGLATED